MGIKKRAKPQPRARAKKAKAKSNGKREYPPFGEKKFWDWFEKAEAAKARKKQIGNEVQAFLSSVVEKYTEDDYDPRRDIAWYMEQLGNDLRGDVEREKAAERRAQATKNNP